MSLTVGKMQKYLEEKYKRTKPEELKNTQRYFLKLIEEIGELAEVIRKIREWKMAILKVQ